MAVGLKKLGSLPANGQGCVPAQVIVCPEASQSGDFPGGTSGKESTCQCKTQEMWVRSLDQDNLEEEMATHSSVLAWKIHGQRNLVATVHQVAESDITDQACTCPSTGAYSLWARPGLGAKDPVWQPQECSCG